MNLPTSSLVEVWQAVEDELALRRLKRAERYDPNLEFENYTLGHIWRYGG